MDLASYIPSLSFINVDIIWLHFEVASSACFRCWEFALLSPSLWYPPVYAACILRIMAASFMAVRTIVPFSTALFLSFLMASFCFWPLGAHPGYFEVFSSEGRVFTIDAIEHFDNFVNCAAAWDWVE